MNNTVMKPMWGRSRPRNLVEFQGNHGDYQPALSTDHHGSGTSFPSGHSASAFAFANGVSGEMPELAVPLRLAAAAVAWSRVHTGVHYPGDVITGSLIGGAVGEAVGWLRRRHEHRLGTL